MHPHLLRSRQLAVGSCQLSGIVLLLFLTVACKPARPEGILSEGEMEDMLYDYHLAQGMAESNASETKLSKTELLAQYQQAVFEKHGTSQEIFDSSMVFYASDLEILNGIYDHVQKRMEHDAQLWATVASTSQDIYSNLANVGDTANVWTGSPIFVLKNHPAENFQHWNMTCDTTWQAGDDVMWRFNAKLITKEMRPNAFADLVVTYTNDSVRSFHASFSAQDRADFRVRSNRGWTPKTIVGHLYLPIDETPEHASYYIITKISLIRFHKKQQEIPIIKLDSTAVKDSTMISDTLTTLQ